MPTYQRRPGVYLEESLLISPADVSGTFTVAGFVGVAEKGPINEPTLIESWSDYVTTFGTTKPIRVPAPANPFDVTGRLGGRTFANLTALQADATIGNNMYSGAAFTAGQYVTTPGLTDSSKAYYETTLSTNRATAAPLQQFAADAEITASDSTNAAKLTGEGFTAAPTSAWTTGQNIWVGPYAFFWNGTAWTAGTGGGGTAKANNGTWKGPGVYPGTPPPPPGPRDVLTYLPFAVYSYFQSGGRLCWVVRSAPQSGEPEKGVASKTTVPGMDDEADPLDSFTLTAISPGLWGDSLRYNLTTQETVEIPVDSGHYEDVFVLQILMRNSDGIDEVLETYPGLSVTGEIPSTRRIDAALNDISIGSGYVRVSNLNPDQPQPTQSTATPVAFSGGADPFLPDAADLEASVKFFDKVEGPVTINISGYHNDVTAIDTNETVAEFVSGCVPATGAAFPDRQDIFIVNDSAPPRMPTQSSAHYKDSLGQFLFRTAGESQTASYTPWILIPHPQDVGRVVAIPPGGAVMGVMARVDATIGVFRAPAGMIAGISNAIGVQTKFTDSELGALNTGSNINVIRSVVGAGICIMGARTRKTFGVDKYINARRTLIYIKESLKRGTEFAVFENNDEALWSALIMSADRVLRPLWEAGGLRGISATDAYYIRCDETLNTPNGIAAGEVRMEVGVALEYPAEFVIIRVTQFDRGNYTTEVQPAQ